MRSRERTVSSRQGGWSGIEHKLSGQRLVRVAVPQLAVQSFYWLLRPGGRTFGAFEPGRHSPRWQLIYMNEVTQHILKQCV